MSCFYGNYKEVPFSRETTLDSIRNNRVRNNRLGFGRRKEIFGSFIYYDSMLG